jgi:hypothetical protein
VGADDTDAAGWLVLADGVSDGAGGDADELGAATAPFEADDLGAG